MNLSAAVNIPAEGIILEATLSKGMGTSVTAIIQRGILRVGDLVLAGPSYGRVKRLIDDQGRDIMEAKPATPVQVD